MEQFTDKEILDEFIKRFDFTHETTENDYQHDTTIDWVSLRNFDGVYLGNMGFTFNKRGQFIDDVPSVQVDTTIDLDSLIDDMEYDNLVMLLGMIADRLRNV